MRDYQDHPFREVRIIDKNYEFPSWMNNIDPKSTWFYNDEPKIQQFMEALNDGALEVVTLVDPATVPRSPFRQFLHRECGGGKPIGDRNALWQKWVRSSHENSRFPATKTSMEKLLAYNFPDGVVTEVQPPAELVLFTTHVQLTQVGRLWFYPALFLGSTFVDRLRNTTGIHYSSTRNADGVTTFQYKTSQGVNVLFPYSEVIMNRLIVWMKRSSAWLWIPLPSGADEVATPHYPWLKDQQLPIEGERCIDPARVVFRTLPEGQEDQLRKDLKERKVRILTLEVDGVWMY